ncbi:MAG: hypothetical protein VW625_01635, partial [Perlucidibaca sp.]
GRDFIDAALAQGAVAHELLPPVSRAGELQAAGYLPVETGYAVGPDGGAHIAVLTPMPGVAPAMWDWWFAWHGSEALRYKLWHPRAHLDVAWADGRADLMRYVGRTSEVTEYVGAEAFRARVSFVPPARMGLDEVRLAEAGEVAICARIGMVIAGVPLDTGWLLHHIRPVAGGAEMRSRFWLAGPYVRPFGWDNALGTALGWLAARLKPITQQQVRELLVHDAQEMGHLAERLPALHARFAGHPEQRS